MKNLFQGTTTALITPFKADGSVDFIAFEKIIEHQIKNKVDAVAISSTTGESATLSTDEKAELFASAVKIARGRIAVIAGTGCNDTYESIELSNLAKSKGVSGLLMITPYYNKPTQDGLFEHFRMIAKDVKIPIMLYNCPSRTGLNMLPKTVVALSKECKNIIAVKEASGDLEQAMNIISNAGNSFSVISGEDNLAVSMIAMGAKGCVSVISNYAPRQFSDMIRFALEGKFKEAKNAHYKLFELMKLNFAETNPIPVKYVMSLAGLAKDVYRMPLRPASAETKKLLKDAFGRAGFKK